MRKKEILSKIKKKPGALPLALNFQVEEVGEDRDIFENPEGFSKGSNLGDP